MNFRRRWGLETVRDLDPRRRWGLGQVSDSAWCIRRRAGLGPKGPLAAQVIEELIRLAKDVREADRRGVKLGLSHDEVAFYDALETNDSAVKVLGDETLKTIARELVDIVRRNVSIDWTVKESARAKLRVIVKRILRKHGYPPDKQESATDTVLAQAEELSDAWMASA